MVYERLPKIYVAFDPCWVWAEPDGYIGRSVIGIRKYMLHLLRFWFGGSLAVTLSGLLSASEHMCCICFVFGLLCLWSEPDISIFHGVVFFSWADCGVQGRRSKLLMLPRVHLLPCPTLHSARTVPVQCPHSARTVPVNK